MSVVEEIDRYEGLGDDGQTYTVVVLQEVIRAPTMSNPRGVVRGMKELWVDGMKGTLTDDGTVRIVATGVVVRRR